MNENEEFQKILEKEKQTLKMDRKDSYDEDEFEDEDAQDILFTE